MVPRPSASASVLAAVSTSFCCKLAVPRVELVLLVMLTLPVGASLTLVTGELVGALKYCSAVPCKSV